MAAVLDGEYDSVEDAAAAALAEAQQIIQSKQKFTVVGRLRYSPESGWIKADDPKAELVCLSVWPTETQAKNAGSSLAYSTQTHEEFQWFVMPVFHGTPAEYYRERKEAVNAKKVEESSWTQRELARRAAWIADHPGEELPEDMRGPVPLIDPAHLAAREERERNRI